MCYQINMKIVEKEHYCLKGGREWWLETIADLQFLIRGIKGLQTLPSFTMCYWLDWLRLKCRNLLCQHPKYLLWSSGLFR